MHAASINYHSDCISISMYHVTTHYHNYIIILLPHTIKLLSYIFTLINTVVAKYYLYRWWHSQPALMLDECLWICECPRDKSISLAKQLNKYWNTSHCSFSETNIFYVRKARKYNHYEDMAVQINKYTYSNITWQTELG